MKYLTVILIALIMLTGCTQSSGTDSAVSTSQVTGTQAVAVEAVAASLGDISRYTELSGSVIAKHSLPIMAENTGKISGLTVEVGDYVEKDQVIARIDPSRPGMTYGRTDLKAPMSGTITALNISEGGYASPSALCGTVTDLEDLRVSVNIPEQYVSSIKEGDTVSLVFDAYPSLSYEGVISFLSPVMDRSSKSRRCEISVKEGPELIVGMYARVSLLTARSTAAVLVPSAAIVNENGTEYVYTVTGGTASRVAVSTGLYDASSVEILSGLTGDETVVIKGQQQLSDGAAVSL